MSVRTYMDLNPDGAYALSGRLAFLSHEKRALGSARKLMLEAGYLAALDISRMGKDGSHEKAARLVMDYLPRLARALDASLWPAMLVAARLGSYGIEKADPARRDKSPLSVKARYSKQMKKLGAAMREREFNGRDLESRAEAAAAGCLSHLAAEAAQRYAAAGAREAAKAVEEYAAFGIRNKPRTRPGTGQLPDNPGWQAEQLFISELNYAYNEGVKAAGQLNAGYIASKWTLSPYHKVTDICDEYAAEDRFGLGPGVFPKGEEPGYPHPNCRCWLAPIFTDRR